MRNWPAYVLLIFLFGCDSLVGPEVSVRLSTPKSVSEQDKLVLTHRLNGHATAAFADLKISSENGIVTITNRGMPDDFALHQLIERQGLIAATSEDQRIWFTNADIRDAHASIDEQGLAALDIKLTEEAGKRLQELSAQNEGKVIVVTLDGKELTHTKVQGKFGERIRLTLHLNAKEVIYIATIVATGSLSQPFQIAQIQRKS